MLIPKRVKQKARGLIDQLISEKQVKISEIKNQAYDYVYDRLPWWADFLFEKFIATRIDAWVNKQISEAIKSADNN